MIGKELVIKNKFGIHARVAAAIVESASKFTCDVYLVKDDVRANASSIMEILMIAASQGETVRIEADGVGCERAVQQITDLFDSGFGEPM